MDNPAVIALWLFGVVIGVVLALRFLRRPSDEPEVRLPGLGRAVSSFAASVRRAVGRAVDNDAWAELGDTLLAADVGVATSERVLTSVREREPATEEEAIATLREAIRAEFLEGSRALVLGSSPTVILVIGVNGTGKTTTIAKLGRLLMSQGKSVLLGAADTYRAGAANQLRAWGDRLATRVVVGAEGADPASVAYDAVESARSQGIDVVIVDTAGRLHGKKNLMDELEKIHRVAGGERGVDEVLLVLDATAGQNGLTQVREFAGAIPVTGIVLTKLDGTAKGGIVLAVERELSTPVKFVGVGERIDDLVPFDPDRFADALLGVS
ncbi:MAG: signal recognition particle-docking protein FtsY [Acidimicrobiia bacterium]|nr:signal recognition particle-docking protein FtsY [Acidimicrobiia bacterium]